MRKKRSHTKRTIWPLVILSGVVQISCEKPGAALQDGDIVFQTSKSAQSKAIQIATKSPYSHMGIVFVENGRRFVLEAVQPVKLTPLDQWIGRGEGRRYAAKRLKNAREVLGPETIKKLKVAGERYKGKPYDVYFGWSDERIYCSELVWKMYKQALGVEIGTMQRLRDLDLTDPIVANRINERYGANPPLDEPVISPAAMFESELLETVIEK